MLRTDAGEGSDRQVRDRQLAKGPGHQVRELPRRKPIAGPGPVDGYDVARLNAVDERGAIPPRLNSFRAWRPQLES
jgi:hypothetical protein